MDWQETIKSVKPADQASIEASKRHWDNIAKPLNGLGLLEQALTKIAGIQGTCDIRIQKKAIIVMCADNGVVAEGVTQSDQSVTAIVAQNIGKGIASVNRMAAVANAQVVAVDIGVAEDLTQPNMLIKKVAYGTKNMAKEAAMSREEAISAISVGIELVHQLKEQGIELIGTGEMGIGNTTTSSAIASVMLGVSVRLVTGKGAGLSKEGMERKIAVIEKAIEVNKPQKEDPLDVLHKIGGLDIGGLVGVYLGGAIYRVPIIIDGLISGISALLATRLCPDSRDYMLPSHRGKEPSIRLLMDTLEMEPIIHGQLALGEGTGTALLFPMLDMAYEVYAENSTFEDVNIVAYQKYEEC